MGGPVHPTCSICSPEGRRWEGGQAWACSSGWKTLGALTLQTPSTTALTSDPSLCSQPLLAPLAPPRRRYLFPSSVKTPQTEGRAGPIFLQPLWLNLQACKSLYFSARGESGAWSAAGGAVFLSLFPALNAGLGERPQAPAGAHLGQQEAPGSPGWPASRSPGGSASSETARASPPLDSPADTRGRKSKSKAKRRKH